MLLLGVSRGVSPAHAVQGDMMQRLTSFRLQLRWKASDVAVSLDCPVIAAHCMDTDHVSGPAPLKAPKVSTNS